MTLYNKDGTVYKLSGPNPMMKNQDFWGDFLTHNMNWKPEVYKDERKEEKEFDKNINVNNSFVEELESTKELELTNEELESTKELELTNEEPHIQPRELEPTKEVESTIKEPNLKVKDNKISSKLENLIVEKTFVYCLPSFTREKRDSLYDDVSIRTQYKEKTSFEAVILKQNDMKIEMWSEVLFNEGSILYPKNGDKRWWRIQNYYPKLGGYVLQAVPSQDQPYFE